MSDGITEPIQFTRGDAERLAVMESNISDVKKLTNRVLKIMYGTGISVMLIIIKEVYSKVNGG